MSADTAARTPLARALELAFGMPDDLADAHLALHGIDADTRALARLVRGAVDEEPAYADAPPAQRLDPGDGRYERVRLLSDEGATAEVWLARDVLLGREVAVKLFRDAGRDLGAVIAEASALAKVKSEHVVAVYDVVRLDGRVAIIMERVGTDGGTRPTLDVREPRRPEAIVRLVVGVARGLAAAHARGVFHLDLKPTNVLVDSVRGVPRARVSDFGLARIAADRRGGDETFVGVQGSGIGRRVVAGTLPWMSPEQAAGLPLPLDPVRHADTLAKVDVHGLGALTYGLVCGRAPNATARDDGRGRIVRLQAIARGEGRVDVAAAAKASGRSVPRGLAAIVRRAMDVAPSARFPSAAALADALEAWLARRRTVARAAVAAGSISLVAAIALGAGLGSGGTRGDAATVDDATARATDPSANDRRLAPPGGREDDALTTAATTVTATAPSVEPRDAATTVSRDGRRTNRGDDLQVTTVAHDERGRLTVAVPELAGEGSRRRLSEPPDRTQPPAVFARRVPGAELIVDPPPDTPERLVLDLLTAAREPDETKGWQSARALVHHGFEVRPDKSLEETQWDAFRAMRRSVWRYCPDVDIVSYWLSEIRPEVEAPQVMRVFVERASRGGLERDIPKLFRVARDRDAGNAWRFIYF